jgi:carboxypeptidase Q
MKRSAPAALVLTGLLALAALSPAAAQSPDYGALGGIRDEGLHRSQVMDTLSYLTDVVGPRLTGSPQLKAAQSWAIGRFKEWGLADPRNEAWGTFGRGWSFSRAAVHMVKPQETPLLALPKGWSPATEGAVRGQVVQLKIASEKDLEPWRGKIAGKIILLEDTSDTQRPAGNGDRRFDDHGLEDLYQFPIPADRPEGGFRERARERTRLRNAVFPFLAQEKVLATIEISSREWGVLRLGGTSAFRPGDHPGVPALVMAVEHWNRIHRLLERKIDVELEVDVAARFYDDDLKAYNTLAEIPGSDLKGEVVMAGAHIDSWHTGQGATDNASGVAVVMEAARILKTLGLKPRRTIRFALWSGEEQGLLGSTAYVENHFAARPLSKDKDEEIYPPAIRKTVGPLEVKPEHAKLAAYFNLDNGSGKIRGIYTNENAAVVPIFQAWLAPFADLGATQVTMRSTGSTDHVPFDRAGLPGFQFIQDQLDYFPKTHHSNLDVVDHAERDDLMQASVLMAAFLYDAAMRPEMLPRKPLPKGNEPR